MLMTIDEVAAYLKVHPDTVRRRAREGDIPAAKIGKQWRFHSDMLAKLRRRRNGAGPSAGH